MTSPCYTCKYSSADVRFCGKGLPVQRYNDCSGYIESATPNILGLYSLLPGCDFPVSMHKTKSHPLSSLGLYQPPNLDGRYIDTLHKYYINSYNPAISYLITWLSWVLQIIPSTTAARGIEINMYCMGYDRNVFSNSVSVSTSGSAIPGCLWWLDPTLTHEEVVPMYALLLAIEYRFGGFSYYTKTIILDIALLVGEYCKSKSIEEWGQAIVGYYTQDHTPGRTYTSFALALQRWAQFYEADQVAKPQWEEGAPCPTVSSWVDTPLWGKSMYELWKQRVDRMYDWLDTTANVA